MRWVVLAILTVGCWDFQEARRRCAEDGRCLLDAGASGGSGGALAGGATSGGGGGGMSGGAGGGLGGGTASAGGAALEDAGCDGVELVAFRHHLSDTAAEVVSPELTVSAQALDGGQWGGRAVQPLAPGRFCVSGPGPVLISLGPDLGPATLVQTSARSLDLSRWYSGRATAAAHLTGQLRVINLPLGAPWTTDDEVQLFSFSTGLASNLHAKAYTFDAGLVVGNQTFALADAQEPRAIDQSQGDLLYLGRYTRSNAPGSPRTLTSLVRGTARLPLGTPAADFLPDGSFVPLPADRTLQLTWTAPATAAQLGSAVYPYDGGASYLDSSLVVVPDVDGAAIGFVAALADLSTAFTGALTYPNPFSADELLWGEHAFRVRFRPDGGAGTTGSVSYFPTFTSVTPARRDAGVDVHLTLQPARELRVNGLALPGPRATAVSQPISLAWTAPAGGAQRYRVLVLVINSTVTVSLVVWVVDPSETQLTLPALPAGTYAFEVTAIRSDQVSPVRPFAPPRVQESAPLVSSVVSVQ